MRFLILLVLPALLLFAACGNDDDTSTTTDSGAPSLSAETSVTASAPAGSTTSTPSPRPTADPTPSPTRRDVASDHFGENIGDPISYLATKVTGPPAAVPCPFIRAEVVVDCTAEGYGRIAVDIEPVLEVSECRALTTTAGDLIAASCTTVDGAFYFYKIEE